MTWEPERRVAAAVAVLVILLGLSDPAISWFTGPAALGGVVIAALLFLGHRTHALDRLEETTDGTGHAPLGGVFNLSSVHPSGLGGLLLSILAVLVAATYPQGRWLIGLGLSGGVAIAYLLVRRHRPV